MGVPRSGPACSDHDHQDSRHYQCMVSGPVGSLTRSMIFPVMCTGAAYLDVCMPATMGTSRAGGSAHTRWAAVWRLSNRRQSLDIGYLTSAGCAGAPSCTGTRAGPPAGPRLQACRRCTGPETLATGDCRLPQSHWPLLIMEGGWLWVWKRCLGICTELFTGVLPSGTAQYRCS